MQLNNENIAKTVRDVENFFRKAKVSNRDVMKICLVVEETLIRYQKRFGAAHEFSIYKKISSAQRKLKSELKTIRLIRCKSKITTKKRFSAMK